MLCWLVGRRRRIKISGHSMLPVLHDQDDVLVKTVSNVEVGDLVVALHPYRSSVHLVKRVTGFGPGGGVVLEGLNPDESTDSRSFGPVQPAAIVGKVTSRLPADPLVGES